MAYVSSTPNSTTAYMANTSQDPEKNRPGEKGYKKSTPKSKKKKTADDDDDDDVGYALLEYSSL